MSDENKVRLTEKIQTAVRNFTDKNQSAEDAETD